MSLAVRYRRDLSLNINKTYMSIPRRCFCFLGDEPEASWWITTNMGKTYTRAGGKWETVSADKLILESHGCNDPYLAERFPKSHRTHYQKPKVHG
jgi:hypothetical protein